MKRRDGQKLSMVDGEKIATETPVSPKCGTRVLETVIVVRKKSGFTHYDP